MSLPLGTYSFLPWLRQGLANNITAADKDVNVKLRATATITVTLHGEGGPDAVPDIPIPKDVQLFGPGDIVGIDARAIIKHEPRNWITNFEPNYLPYVEFYDEDFPWRYTPATPTGHRLRPWLTLVVLKEGEFEEATNVKDKPSPFIKVTGAATKFPLPDQLWGWAHVHTNLPLHNEISSGDGAAAADALQDLLNQNPDLAYSRIVCPRRLEPNIPYHAFLIPTYESGRLAGLGLDPADAAIKDKYYATLTGWEDHAGYTRQEPEHFPVYFRWYFRSGTVGDFEYLVTLLKPKPVDVRVGTRDMDVQTPGSNVLPINTNPDLLGVLKLGGALQVPQVTLDQKDKDYFNKYETWDQAYPHPFQKSLAELVNLADDYADKTTAEAHAATESLNLSDFDNPGADPDPVITAPIYGRWHAKVERLLFQQKADETAEAALLPNVHDWVHEANLDPRFRVPAGFGTKVVQKYQEEYMDAAWSQIGQVLETNRKIRQGQLAKEVSFIWYDRHLRPLLTAQPERALMFMAPVQNRIVAAVSGITAAEDVLTVQNLSHSTLQFVVQNSLVPPVLTSAPMRRVMRPGARIMKTLAFDETAQPGNLLTRVNEGEVLPAPPKTAPSAVPTLDDLANAATPANIPDWLVQWLRKHPWIKFIPLIIGILLLLLMLLLAPIAVVAGLAIAVAWGLFAFFWQMVKWSRIVNAADAVRAENMTPEAVDQLPKSPNFRISAPGVNLPLTLGSADSVQAVRFKGALKDVNTVLVASKAAGTTPPKVKLNLATLSQTAFLALDPDKTIPKHIMQGIVLPFHIAELLPKKFDEVWGYPEFDIPMYKPLSDLGDELFLPNLNLIEQNSITILQTNRRFIEAYMLGLNHEFARELLWREYPTDQRGSSFRQFWDVKGMMKPATPAMTDVQWKDILRDISPIHQWRDPLGENDKPTEGEKIKENIVLVIRGELLKKYPTAVIYAHKAKWQLKNGVLDNTQERRLADLSPAQEENPPRDIVKTPLFEAKVDPDIYFFGFDLDPLEARGGTGESNADLNNPGWFFVIKERPGEPRFGLDDNVEDTPLNTWNDMTWKRALGGTDTPGAFLEINNATPTLTLTEPTGDVSEKHPQWEDDRHISWDKDMSAAELAYILYQVPVMVAVHAAEMLPQPKS